jgi:hypothetical protein
MGFARRSPLLYYVTIAVIASLMAVPLISSVFPVPGTPLKGINTSYHLPKWSLAQFRQNKLQPRIEVWASRAQPLWSWSIKVMNQLVYSTTGEISLDYGTSVQGGNDGYLWQPMYLRSITRKQAPPRKKIVSTFKALKKAQDLLAQHRIPLVAVINPNLLALYPELLPTKYQSPSLPESSYAIAQEAIARYQPAVINTYELLKAEAGRYPFRFFEPTGSHWNDIGSCIAARAVSIALADGWGEPPPSLHCESHHMELPPREPEMDLLEITNLLLPERLLRPAPYLNDHPQARFKEPKRILLVGTSFLFALEHQLLKHTIADSTQLLFYFRQQRRNGKGHFANFDKRSLTKEELLSFDAVIVDANVAGPGIMGYGFLRYMNALLDPAEAEAIRARKKKKGH